MLCLDASFLVNVLIGALDDEHAALWETWQGEGRPMVAPTLLRFETTNALYWLRWGARIDEVQLQLALRALSAMPITYVDDHELGREALSIAYSFDVITLHAAYYVALAARHGADLWTSDERVYNDFSWRLPWVHHAPNATLKKSVRQDNTS